MANRRRGEVEAIIDGRPHVLCLPLGALCELEAAFAVDDLAALATRFASGRLTARDLLRILACGLRGGGLVVDDAEVAVMRFDGGAVAAAAAVADLLAVTFGAETEATPPGSVAGAPTPSPRKVPGAETPSPGTR